MMEFQLLSMGLSMVSRRGGGVWGIGIGDITEQVDGMNRIANIGAFTAAVKACVAVL